MRRILKYFLVSTASLYIVSQVVSGIAFSDGVTTLLLTGAVLAIVSLVIKPIINILILPINLLTFGFFRWVGFAVALYIVTLLVPSFKLMDFAFKGFSSYWFSIPAFSLGGVLAFIAFSFFISFISGIIDWVLK